MDYLSKNLTTPGRILPCTVVAVVLYSSFGFATTYRVSSAAEIRAIMSSAQPGDTLVMTNGVWTDERLVFQGDGAEDAPIVLCAETPGYVILTGTSNLRIAGSYLVVEGLRFVGGYSPSGAVVEFRNGSRWSHHSRLTRCAIVNYNPASKTRDYKWVSLYGSDNRVDHCYFAGKTHSGTTLVVWLSSQPNYHRIDHNYFGYRPPLGMNGGETIRVGTSDWSMYDSFTTVEYNYFERCNGETEIISNKSVNNIYRYNTFFECEGTLTLRHGNRCRVEGNFFLGNQKPRTGGVRVIGEDHTIINNYFDGLYGSDFRAALPIMNGVPNSPLNRYFQVKNALIAFNTFVDCRYTMIIGAGKNSERTLPPENCVIANNLVMTSTRIITQEDEPIDMIWEGNLMQGSSLGITPPAGITLADPKLVLAADGLWRPDSSSPGLGAAEGDYPFVVDDMDGQLRVSSKDVGADQLSPDPIVRRPLTANDTGPEWMVAGLPVVLSYVTVGAGTVRLDPAGGVYEPGTVVTLTAIPDSGWKFAGWQGDVTSASPSLSIVMDGDKWLAAVFVEDRPALFALSVYVFSSGGTVLLDPPGGSYVEGTVVRLTAVPDSGWRFVNWGGSLTGANNPDSLIMDADKNVFATFEQVTTRVALEASPAEYVLRQNFPNPFNATTTIAFSLARPGLTTISLYDVVGNRIMTLVHRFLDAGSHRVALEASQLPSGIYFYEIRSGEFVSRRKLSLLK